MQMQINILCMHIRHQCVSKIDKLHQPPFLASVDIIAESLPTILHEEPKSAKQTLGIHLLSLQSSHISNKHGLDIP